MITTEDARKRSDNCYGVNPETNECFSSRNLCSAVNERSANDTHFRWPHQTKCPYKYRKKPKAYVEVWPATVCVFLDYCDGEQKS